MPHDILLPKTMDGRDQFLSNYVGKRHGQEAIHIKRPGYIFPFGDNKKTRLTISSGIMNGVGYKSWLIRNVPNHEATAQTPCIRFLGQTNTGVFVDSLSQCPMSDDGWELLGTCFRSPTLSIRFYDTWSGPNMNSCSLLFSISSMTVRPGL